MPVQRTGMGLLVPRDDAHAVGRAILEVLRSAAAAFNEVDSQVVEALNLDQTISRYEEVFRSATIQ